MEQWRDIEGYQGLYQVSDMGNVRNVKTNKIRKPILDGGGYLSIDLYKDGKRKIYKIHRLVACAFIPNPENKSTVDHINTIRTDNRVSNLRWFTQKEQINENEISKERHRKATSTNGKRAITNAIEKRKKKVMCITTGQLFDSTDSAAKYYNINKKSVSGAANPKNKQKKAGKLPDGTPLEWRYIS